MFAVLGRVSCVPTTHERPTRQHAVATARTMFVSGERVDMRTVCEALSIGRTTLHRWVGDRERLLGDVLGSLTDDTWDLVAAEARGEGLERALDAVTRFMSVTAAFPPLKHFAEREPALALRVLFARESHVQERIRAGVQRVLSENLRPDQRPEAKIVEIMVQIATALEWTPIVIGQEPEIDRAIDLMRTLAHAGPAVRATDTAQAAI